MTDLGSVLVAEFRTTATSDKQKGRVSTTFMHVICKRWRPGERTVAIRENTVMFYPSCLEGSLFALANTYALSIVGDTV